MQVFDHQDEGPLLRGVQEQMPQQRKGPGLPPLGAALCQGLRGDWEVQELEQQGHVGVRRHATRMQPLLHGGRVDRRRVALHEPAHLLQQITHQQVGGALPVRQTLPRIHCHLVPRHAAAEFGQQPGLAHAGRPHEAHHLALPRPRRSQVVVEPRQLPGPPHKGTLVPHTPPCHPRMAPHEPLHCIDGHGRGTAVHRQGAAGVDPHLRLHELVGGGTQENRPGHRLLLEPQGQVRRGAHHRGVPLRVLSEPPDDHQARVHPHPYRQGGAGRRGQQHGMGPQALVQGQGGQHRPPGMVLLGHRRAEHGQDAGTHRRQERPAVAVQHLLRQPHHRLHVVIQLLRTQPGVQGRCLSEPTAEHTDRLVFPGGEGPHRPGSGGPGRRGEGHVRERRGHAPQGWPRRRWRLERQVAALHRGHKPIAPPAHRVQHGRRAAGIVQRRAHRQHTGMQDPIAHRLPRPHLRQQLLCGHHAVAVPQQIGEQLTGLGPQRDRRPGLGEGIARWIKPIGAKAVLHPVGLLWPCDRDSPRRPRLPSVPPCVEYSIQISAKFQRRVRRRAGRPQGNGDRVPGVDRHRYTAITRALTRTTGRFLRRSAQQGSRTGDAAHTRQSRFPRGQHAGRWTVAALEDGAPGTARGTARLHGAGSAGLARPPSPPPPGPTAPSGLVHAGAARARLPQAA